MRGKFDFNLDDVKAYFQKHGKKIRFKEEPIDPANKEEKLVSLGKQAETISKSITKKIVLVLIIIPISVMLIKVLIKTYMDVTTADRKTPKVAQEDFQTFKIDEDKAWKLLKEEQLQKIQNEMETLRVQVRKELNATISQVNQALMQNRKALERISERITQSNQELQRKLENIKEESLQHIEQISEKTKRIKEDLKEELTNTLPAIPPLPKMQTSSSSTSSHPTVTPKAEIRGEQNKVALEYAPVEIMDEIEDSIPQERNESNATLPRFTLMPGFVKGVLINGGEVEAFLDAKNEPAPIFIRLTGDQLIANDERFNIDGCLILATARAKLSKKAVDVRLSKISCSLRDLDDNRYRIEQNIQGWVFSETGTWGIPGRLVTHESEILKAGIPLAMIEGMINTLSNVLNRQYTNTIGGANYYIVNPQDRFVQGATGATQNILRKFSDYYLKMLDALNPVISIRAGREVVVAFKGGEEMQLQPYQGLQTDYFFMEASNE